MPQIFTQGTTTNVVNYSAQGAVVKYNLVKRNNNGSVTPTQVTSDVPLLLTSIQMQYQRRASKLYPINTEGNKRTVVNLHTAPAGVLQVGSMFSPNAAALTQFITDVSRACSDDMVVMMLQPFGVTCTDPSSNNINLNGAYYMLYGVLLDSLNLTIQGGETGSIDQPLTFSFDTLSMDVRGSDAKKSSTGGGSLGDVVNDPIGSQTLPRTGM